MEITAYIGVFLVVVFASLLKGITGFGFALVSLPLLLQWYSPQEIIPVLVSCNFLASILILTQKKSAKLITNSYKILIIYGGIFSIAGVFSLKFLPEQFLIIVMAIFFIALSLSALLGFRLIKTPSLSAYKIAGAFIGFLTGSISISGPPLAIFLQSTNADNKVFREVFAWFSVVSSSVSIVAYFLAGLYSTETFLLTATFSPILLLGTVSGKRLNHILPQKWFNKLILTLSIVSCLFLIFNKGL